MRDEGSNQEVDRYDAARGFADQAAEVALEIAEEVGHPILGVAVAVVLGEPLATAANGKTSVYVDGDYTAVCSAADGLSESLGEAISTALGTGDYLKKLGPVKKL